ncbi:MAG: DUF2277 domain-containing protein [Pseudomonadota bacterium]
MCRNIRPLFNYDPPSTEQDAHAAALQFVRKVAGTRTPSQVNQAAFDKAVDAISAEVWQLLSTLQTQAPPRNRELELQRSRDRRLRE